MAFKKILILVALLFPGVVATAQVKTEKNKKGEVVSVTVGEVKKRDGAAITFTEEEHDFGDIVQGDVVKYTFKFKNSGNEPLKLSNVVVTCGCTATDWPKEIIKPGEESSITVQFSSRGKMGIQNKIIRVMSNSINFSDAVKIKANVLPKRLNLGDG